MAMIQTISGTYNMASLGTPTLSQLNELILQCDTSQVATIINLPKISAFGGQLTFRCKINDLSNNASNRNIAVNTGAGDTFLNSQTQVIMNTNGVSGEIVMTGSNRWSYFFPTTVITATSQLLTISATTNINATNLLFTNFYASSGLTSWTASFSNIPDGITVTIDYLKTTASDTAITFPVGTIINVNSNASIVGTVATLTSTASGRYTITILNINSVYKVFITQDVL